MWTKEASFDEAPRCARIGSESLRIQGPRFRRGGCPGGGDGRGIVVVGSLGDEGRRPSGGRGGGRYGDDTQEDLDRMGNRRSARRTPRTRGAPTGRRAVSARLADSRRSGLFREVSGPTRCRGAVAAAPTGPPGSRCPTLFQRPGGARPSPEKTASSGWRALRLERPAQSDRDRRSPWRRDRHADPATQRDLSFRVSPPDRWKRDARPVHRSRRHRICRPARRPRRWREPPVRPRLPLGISRRRVDFGSFGGPRSPHLRGSGPTEPENAATSPGRSCGPGTRITLPTRRRSH